MSELKEAMKRIVRKGYAHLALAAHPDHGGDNAEMRALADARRALDTLIEGGAAAEAPSGSNWAGLDAEPHVEGDVVWFACVRCVSETDLAICCMVGRQNLWFPKSQVSPQSEVQEDGHVGRLVVTVWIARKKGLI